MAIAAIAKHYNYKIVVRRQYGVKTPYNAYIERSYVKQLKSDR